MTPPAFVTANLTADRIARFSAAMHDPNPVHLDPDFAASIGLDGIIAPGGIAVVALTHAATVTYGIRAIREIDIAMRSPVPEGESLRCEIFSSDDDGDTITLTCQATGRDGAVRAEGTVQVQRQNGEPT